jgi:hypothetical protein
MLREIPATYQNNPNTRKHWFTDSDMDLFIWHENEAPVRFQLSYNKQASEHVLNWNSDTGFSHNRIDTGEDRAHLKYKMSPILLPDAADDSKTQDLARKFLQASNNVQTSTADFIYARLLEYPKHRAKHPDAGPAEEDL